jgi:hypothetical protein
VQQERLAHADADAFGVGGEAFGFGEGDGVGADLAERVEGVLLDGDDLDEVEDGEAAADAAIAAGGEDVVGAGDVVAHGLRGVVADEDGAGVLDPAKVGAGVDGEVLRGEAVGEGLGFLRGGGDEDEALSVEGLEGDGVVLGLAAGFEGDLFGELGLAGDEDGESFGVVLGLGDEVGGDAGGVAGLGGDDDLGGAGGHVDSTRSRSGAAALRDGDFGGGDVEVAGADDLGYGFDRGCAVGEGGDGLGAADAVELGDAGEVRGGEGFAGGFGAADDDARDAGDLCGGGGHEQGGGQGVTAAGDVAADGAEGADDLADLHAVGGAEAEGARELLFGEGADVGLGEAHGGAELFAGGVPGGAHLFAGDEEGLAGCEVVEAGGAVADGVVAAVADGGEDLLHDGVDLGGVGGAALLELPEDGFGGRRVFAECLEDLHRSPERGAVAGCLRELALHLAALFAGAGKLDALHGVGAARVDALGVGGVDDNGEHHAGVDLLVGGDAGAEDDLAAVFAGLLNPHGDLGDGRGFAEEGRHLQRDDGGVDGDAVFLRELFAAAHEEVAHGDEAESQDGDTDPPEEFHVHGAVPFLPDEVLEDDFRERLCSKDIRRCRCRPRL